MPLGFHRTPRTSVADTVSQANRSGGAKNHGPSHTHDLVNTALTNLNTTRPHRLTPLVKPGKHGRSFRFEAYKSESWLQAIYRPPNPYCDRQCILGITDLSLDVLGQLDSLSQQRDQIVYCRRCLYHLALLRQRRCPECGQRFNPGNTRTFTFHPRVLQSLRISLPAFTIALAALAIFYGCVIFRYLPNGRAIYKINTYGRKGLTKTETIGPSWLKIAVPDKYLERVTHIRLSGMRKPVTDGDLRILNGLTNLKSLILANTRLTDAGLTHIAQAQQLTHLAINNTALTDAGLVHLKGLTNLKELDLEDTNVVGHGLVNLQHLSSLKELHLGLTPLADVGIEHINALTSLEVIQLQYTNVTDVGLARLQDLPNLKDLSLKGTKITSAGMKYVDNLTNLRFLSLSRTEVDDAGMANLGSLDQLVTLYTAGSNVTDDGISDLNEKLPGVSIRNSWQGYGWSSEARTSKGLQRKANSRPPYSASVASATQAVLDAKDFRAERNKDSANNQDLAWRLASESFVVSYSPRFARRENVSLFDVTDHTADFMMPAHDAKAGYTIHFGPKGWQIQSVASRIDALQKIPGDVGSPRHVANISSTGPANGPIMRLYQAQRSDVDAAGEIMSVQGVVGQWASLSSQAENEPAVTAMDKPDNAQGIESYLLWIGGQPLNAVWNYDDSTPPELTDVGTDESHQRTAWREDLDTSTSGPIMTLYMVQRAGPVESQRLKKVWLGGQELDAVVPPADGRSRPTDFIMELECSRADWDCFTRHFDFEWIDTEASSE